jgi:CRISPR-associated protein Csd1
MLLQRLREYSARLPDLGPPLYKRTPVRYQIELDREGRFLGLVPLTGDPGRRGDRGMPLMAPTRVRSSAIKPILFADNGEYTLGRARDPEKQARVDACHAAYRELVRRCAEATGEPDALAVDWFYEHTNLASLELPADFDPSGTITFSVEGRRPIDLPAVQAFWAAEAGVPEEADPAALAQCLICGQARPPVERLQFKIKGIPGGQTSGTSLISANADAFESYGLSASLVSPVCQECSERFSKALNALLAGPATHLRLPPLAYAFWTREPVDFDWAAFFTQPDPGAVGELLRAAQTGRFSALGLDTTPFYAVALSASGGRAVVRDWLDTTAAGAAARLARYFRLQRLVDRDSSEPRFFSLRALAGATQRERDTGEPAPIVPQALARLALAGGPLPTQLLALVLGRLRAGDPVTPARAALVKMVLLSQQPDFEEDEMVTLDPDQTHPAYLCGRLFAILDRIQQIAIGPNATIVDRFFGTASSAPATVFGRLVRGAQPHLGKLRKTRPGAHVALERRLEEVMQDLPGFPATLTLKEQGLFVLGYYHERAASAAAARARRAAGDSPGDARAALPDEAPGAETDETD